MIPAQRLVQAPAMTLVQAEAQALVLPWEQVSSRVQSLALLRALALEQV
jgi:hypothetical protein